MKTFTITLIVLGFLCISWNIYSIIVGEYVILSSFLLTTNSVCMFINIRELVSAKN